MLLNIKNLRKDYSRGKTFSAVDNVSFMLESGNFACIMGKSGSGKTTLLNMIAGIITPTNGKITILNTDIHSLDDNNISQFRNNYIGYVPQGSSLLSTLNVIENICLPLFLYPNKQQNIDCKQKALNLLEQAGISYLEKTYPSEMSGGELRRVAIIRALMCSPKLVLVDEPTNDLDEESSKEIMELFSEVNKNGTTILMVTHDQQVANYAKRQFKMISGKLIAE